MEVAYYKAYNVFHNIKLYTRISFIFQPCKAHLSDYLTNLLTVAQE